MSTRTRIWELSLDPAFWELSRPFRPLHTARSSTFLPRAGFLAANLSLACVGWGI